MALTSLKSIKKVRGLGFLVGPIMENIGPKRKAEGGGSVEESVFENEKKHKVDDETKRLSILFAIHLGSVEVAW